MPSTSARTHVNVFKYVHLHKHTPSFIHPFPHSQITNLNLLLPLSMKFMSVTLPTPPTELTKDPLINVGKNITQYQIIIKKEKEDQELKKDSL